MDPTVTTGEVNVAGKATGNGSTGTDERRVVEVQLQSGETQELLFDSEFFALIPPVTQEERNDLQRSLLRDGCLDTLKVWRKPDGDVLLDGHRRLELCRLGKIPILGVEPLAIATRKEAIEWIIENQLARRNLTQLAMAYLRGKRYNLEKSPRFGKDVSQGDSIPQSEGLSQGDSDSAQEAYKRTTAGSLAIQFGVSKATVERDSLFAAALDRVSEIAGEGIRERTLAGYLKLTRTNVVELAAMVPADVRVVMEKLREGKSFSEAAGKPKKPKEPEPESVVIVPDQAPVPDTDAISGSTQPDTADEEPRPKTAMETAVEKADQENLDRHRAADERETLHSDGSVVVTDMPPLETLRKEDLYVRAEDFPGYGVIDQAVIDQWQEDALRDLRRRLAALDEEPPRKTAMEGAVIMVPASVQGEVRPLSDSERLAPADSSLPTTISGGVSVLGREPERPIDQPTDRSAEELPSDWEKPEVPIEQTRKLAGTWAPGGMAEGFLEIEDPPIEQFGIVEALYRYKPDIMLLAGKPVEQWEAIEKIIRGEQFEKPTIDHLKSILHGPQFTVPIAPEPEPPVLLPGDKGPDADGLFEYVCSLMGEDPKEVMKRPPGKRLWSVYDVLWEPKRIAMPADDGSWLIQQDTSGPEDAHPALVNSPGYEPTFEMRGDNSLAYLAAKGDPKFKLLYINPIWFEWTPEYLSKLPIGEIAHDEAHVHLWVHEQHLPDLRFILEESWGFKFRGVYVYGMKYGIGLERFWFKAHHLLALGVRGDLPFSIQGVKSWGEYPGSGNIRKRTNSVRELICAMGQGPRIDIWTDKVRQGWHNLMGPPMWDFGEKKKEEKEEAETTAETPAEEGEVVDETTEETAE